MICTLSPFSINFSSYLHACADTQRAVCFWWCLSVCLLSAGSGGLWGSELAVRTVLRWEPFTLAAIIHHSHLFSPAALSAPLTSASCKRWGVIAYLLLLASPYALPSFSIFGFLAAKSSDSGVVYPCRRWCRAGAADCALIQGADNVAPLWFITGPRLPCCRWALPAFCLL